MTYPIEVIANEYVNLSEFGYIWPHDPDPFHNIISFLNPPKCQGWLMVLEIKGTNTRLNLFIREGLISCADPSDPIGSYIYYFIWLYASEGKERSFSHEYCINIINNAQCTIKGRVAPSYIPISEAKFAYNTNDQQYKNFVQNVLNSQIGNPLYSSKKVKDLIKESLESFSHKV
ncbi:MAG: hypothetical protein UHG91_01060 [Succinivibrionaceae bacterium]|nr:hypothetical protein [Succinivibrionaceae bacterium]MEE1339354.1 hypothetical protein [Succinivibrionaceae bacterium]